MAKTVIGLFDNMSDARRVVQDLHDSGFERDDISIVSREDEKYVSERGGERTSGAAMGAGAGAAVGGMGGLLVGLSALAIPGVGPVIAAGPLATTLAGAALGATAGGIMGALTDLGVPEEEAHYYAEGVRRGGALVSVETEDHEAERAAEIMARYGAVDLDTRVKQWRQGGWTHFDPNTGPYEAADQRPFVDPNAGPYQDQARERPTGGERLAASSLGAETRRESSLEAAPRQGQHPRGGAEGEVRVPVVEEQLEVGKRIVERGGVRLFTRVVERPVEENVRLRDEHVTVERRPVDRAASEADLAAFKEGTIEITETDEEAIISKRARVVEEVVVHKEVEERTETVRGSARRTEVDVETVGSDRASGAAGTRDFNVYDADFRSHYKTTLASRGHGYERWAPAYRYGYDLAGDKRYGDGDWKDIEPEARRHWEERGQGTWDEFKDTIKYAWDKVRGRR